MLKKILRENKELNYLFRYCLIGVTGVALDFLVFYLLVNFLSLHYQYANIISVSCGIINNYILNARYNFKVTDNHFKRMITFYAVGILGLVISGILLYLLVDLLSIQAIVAKAMAIVIVTVVQYTLNRLFSFKG